jgi:hypothetical protein
MASTPFEIEGTFTGERVVVDLDLGAFDRHFAQREGRRPLFAAATEPDDAGRVQWATNEMSRVEGQEALWTKVSEGLRGRRLAQARIANGEAPTQQLHDAGMHWHGLLNPA